MKGSYISYFLVFVGGMFSCMFLLDKDFFMLIITVIVSVFVSISGIMLNE